MQLTQQHQLITCALNNYLADETDHEERLVQLLEQHLQKDNLNKEIAKILPFIAYSLNSKHLTAKSQTLTNLLTKSRYDAAISNASKIVIIKKIANKLKNIDIDIILLKGMALNNHLYCNEQPRLCSDIDILIRSKDKSKAVNCLMDEMHICTPAKAGKYDLEYEITLAFSNKSLSHIDLHFHLGHPSLFNISEDLLWDCSLEHPYYKSSNIRTLSYSHMFLHNALHSIKDIKFFSYILFDCAVIIKNHPVVIRTANLEAIQWNVQPALSYLLKILENYTNIIDEKNHLNYTLLKLYYFLENTRYAEKSLKHRFIQICSQLLFTNNRSNTIHHFLKYLL